LTIGEAKNIPLVFPLTLKGEMSWLLPHLFIMEGWGGIGFNSSLSKDLYSITQSLKFVAIED
jgi:hypothetical protein